MAPSTPMSRRKVLGFQQLQISARSCKTSGVAMVHGSEMLATLCYCSPEPAVAACSPAPFKRFSRGSLRREELGRDINLGFGPKDQEE